MAHLRSECLGAMPAVAPTIAQCQDSTATAPTIGEEVLEFSGFHRGPLPPAGRPQKSRGPRRICVIPNSCAVQATFTAHAHGRSGVTYGHGGGDIGLLTGHGQTSYGESSAEHL